MKNWIYKILGKPREDKDCTCGKFEKCCRTIHANSQGKIWVEKGDHFRCGKVQKQIKDLEEIYKQSLEKN